MGCSLVQGKGFSLLNGGKGVLKCNVSMRQVASLRGLEIGCTVRGYRTCAVQACNAAALERVPGTSTSSCWPNVSCLIPKTLLKASFFRLGFLAYCRFFPF